MVLGKQILPRLDDLDGWKVLMFFFCLCDSDLDYMLG